MMMAKEPLIKPRSPFDKLRMSDKNAAKSVHPEPVEGRILLHFLI
jgi:hypothetical protein